MSTALLMVVLACLPAEAVDETVRSANGRFLVELTARNTMAFKQKGVAAPRWTLEKRPRGHVVVGDSGTWVVALGSPYEVTGVHLTLYDATGKPTQLRPLELLSEEEQQYLPWSDCGIDWFQKVTAAGDVITIEVPQGGNRRPTDPPGPTLTFKLDARQGTFTRSAPIPRPGIAELIAEHQKEGKAGIAFHRLIAKAQLQVHRGDRTLCGFFGPLAQGSDARLRSMAMDGLVAAQCRPELAAISAEGPRGDDGDLATLEGLARTDPAAASKFAMEALRGRKGPVLLRQRAVILLIEKSNPLRWDAARLALADETAVRSSALSQVGSLPRSTEAFTILLAAAVGSDESSEGTRYAALRYLEPPRDPAWPQLFSEAYAAGKLDSWSGAMVVAAGLAEQRGEPAEELYRRAVTRLEGTKFRPGGLDDEFWCEAKLRLAQLAAAQGKKDDAVKLAKEVLASRSSAMVAAPSPNRYAGGNAWRSANTVAQEIVSAGGVPPPPQPTVQDALKIIRETRQRMDEQRAKRNAPKQ